MDSHWARETRVCHTVDPRADLLAALRAYIDKHELEGAVAGTMVCSGMTSRRTNEPSLTQRTAGDGHETLVQVMLVAPPRLFWSQAADANEAFATSGLLAGLEVTDKAAHGEGPPVETR